MYKDVDSLDSIRIRHPSGRKDLPLRPGVLSRKYFGERRRTLV
ncbi:hypothetical protein LptCag_2634 [Leptospirillum ferriphilum]|uniref:Uncharacterized protein n=1 Tax=Leptospirillum ferriphilum TaxID=178606 RepID=A0A094WF86_9BACT|nr:hypothetical protein LptCag_2634 [Leptospirillum ferriphilum]